MILNKNILITGVGKGLGKEMVFNFVKNGAFVYGITRSRKDIKALSKLKNTKIFYGDVRNAKILEKILKQSIKDKRLINGLVNNVDSERYESIETGVGSIDDHWESDIVTVLMNKK